MMKRINNILQTTLKTDIDYYDLIEDLIVIIKNNDIEYNYLIDLIQVLLMRKAYRFMTFIECEELYKNIKQEIEN